MACFCCCTESNSEVRIVGTKDTTSGEAVHVAPCSEEGIGIGMIEDFDQKGFKELEHKPNRGESSLSPRTLEEEVIPGEEEIIPDDALAIPPILLADEVCEVDKVVELAKPLPDDGYFIRIDKRSGKSEDLGVSLGMQKNVGLGTWTQGGLKINKIKKSGLIYKWNISNDSQLVVVGDILVEVNSVTGAPTRLLDEMGKEPVLKLRFLRPNDFNESSSQVFGDSR